MKLDDVLLVGVKSRVMALSKLDGSVLWSASLPGGMSQSFVTVLSDGKYVFAHTGGQVHGLDFLSGEILWTNELPGCGYGLATLAFPGGATAPDPALARTNHAQQEASSSTTATVN